MSDSQLTFGNGTALCREHNAGFVEAACPYCEIDRLKEEVKEQKELVQMILAEAYRNGVEIIVHEKLEVEGE